MQRYPAPDRAVVDLTCTLRKFDPCSTPTSYACMSPHGLLTAKRRLAACAMNCSSTHSPRCFMLVNRSQGFIVSLHCFSSLFPPSPVHKLPATGWGLGKRKGATGGSRLLTINCLYSFRISNWKGQTGNGLRLYIVIVFMELSPIA